MNDTPTPDLPDRIAELYNDGTLRRTFFPDAQITMNEGDVYTTLRTWFVDDDGLTSIERYAQQQRERADTLAAENRRLREMFDNAIRTAWRIANRTYDGEARDALRDLADAAYRMPSPQEGDDDE